MNPKKWFDDWPYLQSVLRESSCSLNVLNQIGVGWAEVDGLMRNISLLFENKEP